MKKTNIRLVLGSIVLMAAVAAGCGSDYSNNTNNNSPTNQAPAGTAQNPGGAYP